MTAHHQKQTINSHCESWRSATNPRINRPPLPTQPCPQISDAQFVLWFHEVVSVGDDHVICVLEDRATRRIVATGSIFVEKKFLHGCGKIGHIEDVVVDNAVREKKLGQKVVNYLAEHAKRVGCYKVILDCTPELRGFYENCGFVEKNIQMAIYF